MSISLLGGGSDKEGETPEKEVEKMEEAVIRELEDLQGNMEEMFNAESRLVKGLEEGLPKDRIEERISSIEIYLQEDISPEEENLEERIRKLEKREARMKKQGDLKPGHRELLETIEDAVSKVRDERERLREVVQQADKMMSGEDFSPEKILEKLEEELETEGREAQALEKEISEIKGKEREIQS